MPPLLAPPREGARDGGGDGARSGRARRPLDTGGGPWSDEGVSGAMGRPAGLRRPAPPRVPRRVRGRGVSVAVSPPASATGSGMGSGSAAGSASASAAGVSATLAAARERERPAPPRVPRRARGRGASAVASSLGGAASGGGASASVVASGSAAAVVVRLVRPPRRLGFSSAAVSGDGALAPSASLPPCRDRFRKDSHSEITRSPQGSFGRCNVQRFSLL